ncbi:MAG: efflux RND transporter permease subunit [Phycisphaerales bacterium]|nr:efflux RND transporter permease subunit [Phycisphaerales bacterium]
MIEIVRFFLRNRVCGGLLTFGLIIGGMIAAANIRREFYPDIDADSASVLIVYPGASPQEIEDSIARRVEDVAVEIDGVNRIKTTIMEGGGGVLVRFDDGQDVRKRCDDLRDRLESLTDLPTEADRIRVVEFEPNIPVIQVTVSGDEDSETLKSAIRQVADDLKSYSGMGQVVVSGTRDDELRIEVSHSELLRHGIPITKVASAVSEWMREIPGGTVRTADGETKVRTLGVAHRSDQIREIIVQAGEHGGMVRLGDIATVTEGLIDDEVERTFNGEPSANCTVFRQGKQDAVDMAMFTRGYVAARRGEQLEPTLRERVLGSSRVVGWELGHKRGELGHKRGGAAGGLAIQKHNDLAKLIEDRLEMLTSNALQGGVLVFIALLLGVHWRAACLVTLGIAVAIFGTLLVMDLSGLSLNMLTMFALLLTIGIQADDAIVFSDSIDREASEPGVSIEAGVLNGVRRVLWPVVASAATTIVAFVPLGLVQGSIGDLLGALPMVVALALSISLFEACFLMPAHMASAIKQGKSGHKNSIDRVMAPFDRWRDHLLWPSIERWYRRIALWCVDRRYLTVTAGMSVFIFSVALVVGGRVPFTFLPSDDSETLVVDIRLPLGTSLAVTKEVGGRVEAAARAQPEVQAITALYGISVNYETASADNASSNIVQMFIELAPVELRDRRSTEVMDSLRIAAGPLDEAEFVRVQEITGGPAGSDITYEISGEEMSDIRAVSMALKETLLGVDGVLSVADDDFDAYPEAQIELHPAAAALGFTPAQVAAQVRGALYGIDAHVFSENREDVDVRVRMDDAIRASGDLADRLWVVSPKGVAVPVREIADVRERAGASTIRRLDRLRTITVTADTAVATRPESVVEKITPRVDELAREHPSVTIREGGRQNDLNEAFATLPIAMAAAVAMIYAILAWLFGSYTQPFAVMLSIPFGVIGMVFGHMLLGFDVTFLSLIGLIALAGVVVNNALVLLEFINVEIALGRPLREALVVAGQKRIRAILMTSVTGVLGLAPLVLEPSFQARFLAPMAVTLSGGLVSATVLTLILLPSMLFILDDMSRLVGRIWNGPRAAHAES